MKRRRSNAAYWTNAFMLGLECQQAIALRLLKLSIGGPKARRESRKMVTEKVDAAFAAGQLAMGGASPTRLLKSYRTKVRANVKRLSK
ncbi:MAG TPA: hypothetical protein VHU23_16375 [Rhizomicrobium sp.]|jgi:hypothetical protein|nr:hypothetical protein [Rhizomicrobium sp.]